MVVSECTELHTTIYQRAPEKDVLSVLAKDSVSCGVRDSRCCYPLQLADIYGLSEETSHAIYEATVALTGMNEIIPSLKVSKLINGSEQDLVDALSAAIEDHWGIHVIRDIMRALSDPLGSLEASVRCNTACRYPPELEPSPMDLVLHLKGRTPSGGASNTTAPESFVVKRTRQGLTLLEANSKEESICRNDPA